MKNVLIILGVLVLVVGVAFYKSTQTESPAVVPDDNPVVHTQSSQSLAQPVALPETASQPPPSVPLSEKGTPCPEPSPVAAEIPAASETAPPAEESPVFAGGATEVAGVVAADPAVAPASAPATESQARLPRVVDLGAGKCKACKDLAPILEELKKEYAGRVEVEYIDVWKNNAAAEPYKIRIIPTQIFYDREGKEVWRHEGFLPKADFIAKFAELGVK
jgi:thioredoxin 1